MKKLILAILLVLALGTVPSWAQINQESVEGMARYVPEETDVFLAIRTDDGYITTLQDLINNAITKLPPEAGMLPIDLIAQLDTAFQETDTSYAEIRAWLGDYVAFGMDGFELTTDMNPDNDDKVAVYVAFAITDADALRSWISDAPNFSELELADPIDGFDVYVNREQDSQLSIGEDVAYLSTIGDLPRADTPRLGASSGYVDAVSALPAETYNVLVYVNAEPIMSALQAEGDPAFELVGEGFDNIALGLTILDGRALTIDMSQPMEAMPMARINPDYARLLPQDTQLLIWGHNLSDLFNQLIDTLTTLAEQSGDNTDIRTQLQGLLAFTGLDFEEDVLSWMTGDFAILSGADVDLILEAIVGQTPTFETFPFYAGLLVEATDEAKAQNFVNRLGNFLQLALSEQPDVNVTQQDINGEAVFTLTIPLEQGGGMPVLDINIDMGVSNGAFYLATRDVADFVRDGGASLADDARYQYASQFFLPETMTVLYTDDSGLVTSTSIVVLTLLGPAIGNIFDNIVDELQTSAPTTRTAISTNAQQGDPMQEVLSIFNALESILHSSSITIAPSPNGYLIARAVLVLEE
jgi:hypothetical protein